jgi:hypothetical protein
LTFRDGRPVGPDAGAGERTGLVEREPDVAAFGLVELAEGVERQDAAMHRTRPPSPVCDHHRRIVSNPLAVSEGINRAPLEVP